jgi:5-methylcytosine-specific restriction endonuclease McrA
MVSPADQESVFIKARNQGVDFHLSWSLIHEVANVVGNGASLDHARVRSDVEAVRTGAVAAHPRIVPDALLQVLEFLRSNMQVILAGQPEQLMSVNDDFEAAVGLTAMPVSDVTPIIRRIFDYDWWAGVRSTKRYSAYSLARDLAVRVCPYCNRQYTFTVCRQGGKGITRPEYDHFFPQDRYPLLRLSFYNLIPSCKICNSLKSDKPFTMATHMHPYFDGFGDDMRFTYRYLSGRGASLQSLQQSMKIELRSEVSAETQHIERCVRHDEAFSLVDIYSQHSDVVAEIIVKAEAYCAGHLQGLSDLLGITVTPSDVARLVLGTPIDMQSLDQRPLAKLTRDIAREIGWIA